MQRSVIDLQLHVAGAPTGNSPIRDRAAAASEFEPFLPKQNAKPGDTWMAQKTAVLPFLRQIHAGAKTDLHVGCVGGPGTFACLLARDASTIDVLFRSHAEFDLANGTTLPTPAQFEGRLQWSVTDRAPLAFRLAVPDRDTNYDLNAPQGDSGTSLADIGYRPTMELASARAPDPIDPARLEDARGRLRKAFYPSARLEWLYALGDAPSSLRLHTQLFTGYGDSLVDYNRKRTVLRVGLSLVDF